MARPDTAAEIPELGSDADDDEALRYAIALSLQEQGKSGANSRPAAVSRLPLPVASQDAPSSSSLSNQSKTQFGSLFLDRKRMEEERLRRLEKRRRPSEDDDDDDDDVIEVPPPKKQQTQAPLGKLRLPYPDGTVKRTWARGCARTGDDIKIEEVFQKDQLELAVLSSFQWDDEWMLSKLDITRTKLLLIAFARDEAQKEAMCANVPPSIKFCFPPMNGPGSMHSKLQLLKYPGYLRVVVPTGNLVSYDWGETGHMENMVFLIDLPRFEDSATRPSPTMFRTELEYFLQAAGVNDRMIASLSNYDFSKTADIAFVHSIPGGHTDEALGRVGYCGLGTSVAALGLASSGPIEVDLVCSSLGSIKHDLVGAIYNACQGADGAEEYNARTSRKSANKAAGLPQQLQDGFRIYFPTDQTVSKSKGGPRAGGTICVQEKWWQSPSFPRELVRDSINTRDGLLMHSKLIFVRRTGDNGKAAAAATETATGQSPGWAYVGSANLSDSAWGRVSKDRVTGKLKINCRNWECGVVVPVPKAKADEQTRPSVDMSMFAGTVPVPMRVPGPAYGPNDRPWFFPGA